MSAAEMTNPNAKASPRFTARIAGFFWLMTSVAGTFAMVVLGKLVMSGDAAATAANIVAHEPLFRQGVVADLVATACYLAATLFVYALLEPVNRNVSLLAAFFSLAGCVSAAVTFVFRLAPLVVLGGGPHSSVFNPEQLQALALTFLRVSRQGSNISFTFFGLHCLLAGCLIFRSTFLPRIVGALMVGAGLGWLTQSFANLLSPALGLSLSPYTTAAGALGEVTLTMWLLVMGVNVERWKEQASAAAEWRSDGAIPASLQSARIKEKS